MYVPGDAKVTAYVPLAFTVLFVKLGDPVDSTLCVPPAHVHVTVPPAAMVSTAGFEALFRLLVKKKLPSWTAALVAAVVTVAWNVTGEPVSPALVAVIVTGPAVAPSVSVVRATPEASLVALVGDALAVPPVTSHVTPVPAFPFP